MSAEADPPADHGSRPGAGAQAALLPDGRLHLHHGPIDLIIGADGPAQAVRLAQGAAISRFSGLLAELAAELPLLRSPQPLPALPNGPVAQAMHSATAAHAPAFVTPMAAVAGAVADAICATMVQAGGLAGGLHRVHVNNGGDIALHLAPGHSLRVAIAARAGLPDALIIDAREPVRGLATSGWRGRSQSLGIADAVTVLARDAAAADVAATLIANAVDLPGHAAIARAPASSIKADSDLGAQPVTTRVGPLNADETAQALAAGAALAQDMTARGLIVSAALFLNGQRRIVETTSAQRGPQISEHPRIA